MSALTRIPGTFAGFMVLRYAAAGLAALKSLFLAKILGVEAFGTVALVLQLAALLEIVGVGGATGFVLRRFEVPGEPALDRFPAVCTLWMGLAGGGLLVVGLFWKVLFWAALLLLINLPYFALEPPLRVRERLSATVLPLAAQHASVMLLVALLFALHPEPSLETVLIAVASGHVLGQALLLALARREGLGLHLAEWSRGGLRIYAGFVRRGFPMYLGGMLYLLLGFVDRLVIAGFHDDAALGVYSLALQLLLISTLGLQAWSYVATARIGAALSDRERLIGTARDLLRTARLIAGVSALLVTATAWLFERTFYAGYSGLFATTCTVGAGLIAYNATAVVAPVLYFAEAQRDLHRLLGVALAANLTIDAVLTASSQSWQVMIACTSALFVLLALAQAAMVHRALRVRSGDLAARIR